MRVGRLRSGVARRRAEGRGAGLEPGRRLPLVLPPRPVSRHSQHALRAPSTGGAHRRAPSVQRGGSRRPSSTCREPRACSARHRTGRPARSRPAICWPTANGGAGTRSLPANCRVRHEVPALRVVVTRRRWPNRRRPVARPSGPAPAGPASRSRVRAAEDAAGPADPLRRGCGPSELSRAARPARPAASAFTDMPWRSARPRGARPRRRERCAGRAFACGRAANSQQSATGRAAQGVESVIASRVAAARR